MLGYINTIHAYHGLTRRSKHGQIIVKNIAYLNPFPLNTIESPDTSDKVKISREYQTYLTVITDPQTVDDWF